MELDKIIDVFKRTAYKHIKINGFYTGLKSQINDTDIEYPALRVIFPYNSTITDDKVTYYFKLNLLVSTVDIDTGSNEYEHNTNHRTEDNEGNEIELPLNYENQMRAKSLKLMAQYLKGIQIESENSDNLSVDEQFQVTKTAISSLERVSNDNVTGVELAISISTINTYFCEAYEDNVDIWRDDNGDICPTPVELYCPPAEEILPTRYSLDFNGVNQYGQISQQNSTVFDLNWTQPFTFECWVNHTIGETSYLLSKINASSGWFFGTVGSRNVVRLQLRTKSPFGIIDVYSMDTLSSGWNHIVMSYNGGGGAEYDVTFTINNVDSPKPNDWSQGNQLIAGTISTTTLAEIQQLSSFNSIGKGRICNIRLWKNIELTPVERNTLYNDGKVLYDNIPQENSLLFSTGLPDENSSWFGQGWIMQELTGNSNFVFGQQTNLSDRSSDIPS